MVSEPLPQPATYQDIIDLPENMTGQIIDGELYAHPRPATGHARAAGAMYAGIYGGFDRSTRGPGGWIILIEPELHLGRDVLVPDLAAWRRERMPELPRAPFLELAPDWVAEILSPSTARLDRVKKLRKYMQAGVPHVWLVDPDAQTLEVLRLDGEGYRLVGTHGGAEKVRAEPFDAVELDLAALWAT